MFLTNLPSPFLLLNVVFFSCTFLLFDFYFSYIATLLCNIGATWEDAKATEKADNELWKDDWDDDNAGDDFTVQLRSYMEQSAGK